MTLLIAVTIATASSIGACQGGGRHAEYARYLSKVQVLARGSNHLGAEFAKTLLTPGLKVRALESSLEADAAQAQLAYDQAQQILAPAPLRSSHEELLAALELRAKGFAGLGEVLALTPHGGGHTAEIAALAAQGQLLTTSDTVWGELYRPHAAEQMKIFGVTGLAVPASHMVTNADLVSARSFALLLQRLNGIPTTRQPPLLKLGASGSAVVAWQTQLRRWLHKAQPSAPLLAITGIFDAATVSATKALQTSAAITADGVVGPVTRRALTLALASAK